MQVVQYWYSRYAPIVTEASEGKSGGKQRCGRCEVSLKYLEVSWSQRVLQEVGSSESMWSQCGHSWRHLSNIWATKLRSLRQGANFLCIAILRIVANCCKLLPWTVHACEGWEKLSQVEPQQWWQVRQDNSQLSDTFGLVQSQPIAGALRAGMLAGIDHDVQAWSLAAGKHVPVCRGSKLRGITVYLGEVWHGVMWWS